MKVKKVELQLIPFLQQYIRCENSDPFQKTKINTDINPDEAIAYGAAVQGAILAGDKSEQVPSHRFYYFEP